MKVFQTFYRYQSVTWNSSLNYVPRTHFVYICTVYGLGTAHNSSCSCNLRNSTTNGYSIISVGNCFKNVYLRPTIYYSFSTRANRNENFVIKVVSYGNCLEGTEIVLHREVIFHRRACHDDLFDCSVLTWVPNKQIIFSDACERARARRTVRIADIK